MAFDPVGSAAISTGGLKMKISELAEFDGSKYLKDEEAIRHYLAQAFEDGDPRLIQAALGNVAKARGMTALARESGVKREALYRGGPRLISSGPG